MTAAIIIGFVLVDFAVAFFIIKVVIGGSWRPLEQAFPPVEPAETAHHERHRSFKLGLLNLGFSIHAAVDENYLHLTPAKWIGWLRLKPVSIPWSAMTMKKRGQRWSEVKIQRTVMHGPSWCFELAE